MKKEKLLFIHTTQFGYHNNSYKYCFYLRDRYDITFICLDSGHKRQRVDGVKVIYIPKVAKGVNTFLILTVSFLHSLFRKGKTMVFYFKGVILLKMLLPWKKMILDIRTLAVSNDIEANRRFDSRLRQCAMLYDHVTIISEGVREKLNFPKAKSSILPLGADQISKNSKEFNGGLRLLYVGTLYGRDLDKTIIGVKNYTSKYPDVDIRYDIVGDAHDKTILIKHKELAEELELSNVITFHGRIPNAELSPFFDKCNIGVSFVPKTPYYDHQPVTKSFEYIMSGLYTIATSTYCNKEIITDINGILIEDSSDDFCHALEYIKENSSKFNSTEIMQSLIDYRWENIINKSLEPIIKQL